MKTGSQYEVGSRKAYYLLFRFFKASCAAIDVLCYEKYRDCLCNL